MATALAGHNSPPPLESWSLHIEELMANAQQFLDGEPIIDQAQADNVGTLLSMLREARQGADQQRKVEKKPHDDAGKAVQASWMPLLDRVGMAEDVAKRALAPFLAAKEAEQRRIAEQARKDAQAAAAAAQAARNAQDLAGREEAERLAKLAAQAERSASKADKAKPLAAGGGRSVSLRSVWTAALVNPAQALKFYREQQPEGLKAWLVEQANKDVRSGARSISGFTITEERVPV